MKKKLRLPILLLAVVIMLSIFYVKEATKVNDTQPVNNDNLEISNLNPEFTEERLVNLTEFNLEIEELEKSIASGTLTATEVSEATAKINTLKETKQNEAELEAELITSMSYDDVLVNLTDEMLIVDVYTPSDISVETYISIARMAKSRFGVNCKVKLETTNNNE